MNTTENTTLTPLTEDIASELRLGINNALAGLGLDVAIDKLVVKSYRGMTWLEIVPETTNNMNYESIIRSGTDTYLRLNGYERPSSVGVSLIIQWR